MRLSCSCLTLCRNITQQGHTCFEDLFLHKILCQYIKSSQHRDILSVHSLLIQSLDCMVQFSNSRLSCFEEYTVVLTVNHEGGHHYLMQMNYQWSPYLCRYVFKLLSCIHCLLEVSSASATVCGEQCLSTYVTIHARTNRTHMTTMWPATGDIRRHHSSQHTSSNAINVACEWRNKKSPVTPLFPNISIFLYLCSSFLSSYCLLLLGWTILYLQFLLFKF